MRMQSWLCIIAIAAWIVPMAGCQPVGKSQPAGVSFRNFKIEIPPSREGEFNPGEMEVGTVVGNLAPEIEGADLDGVPFKLSDYRGKVVMLDFWGDW